MQRCHAWTLQGRAGVKSCWLILAIYGLFSHYSVKYTPDMVFHGISPKPYNFKHMSKQAKETLKTVNQIFKSFLEQNGYRKTPERFSILREIYHSDGHFDVESLYIRMRNHRYRVSRATLYNTIDLLQECKLVTKNQFGKGSAQYEKSYKFKQHDHVVCLDCGTVIEFCDPRIQEIKSSVENMLDLKISHHALTFYANCSSKCEDGDESSKALQE